MPKAICRLFILTFSHFVLLNSICFSQAYHPIPEDSTVKWVVLNNYSDPGSCVEEHVFEYRMHGDTMINGLNHKKMYVENSHLVSHTTGSVGCSNPRQNGYWAAFRQDTLLKKAFLVLPGFSTDTLLYDFTLGENDTLRSYAFVDPLVPCIDSLFIIEILIQL
jgi:hypothetical protein